MRIAPFWIGILMAAAGALSGRPAWAAGCVAIEGDRITASDFARTLPAFSAVAPEMRIGYAPVPGLLRVYHAAEIQRLAARYGVPAPPAGEICFERAMEPLHPERVAEAMRSALNHPEARIEIVELSSYPVPRGEIQFSRSTLPAVSANPVLWRGFIRYAGEHRFTIWARARVLVRSTRIVAAENLTPGRPIEARQLRLDEWEEFPSGQPDAHTLDEAVGKIPRKAVPAGSRLDASLLEAPKDVEQGDLVRVEVRSGAARVQMDGRAQAAGRRGEAIRVRNLSTGKSFSARIADKGRVELTAALASGAKDGSK
jgi:flagella basal body P-ring formation protein FlgA